MILENLQRNSFIGKKAIGILIDPDKIENDHGLIKLINICIENQVDYFLVGGSLVTTNNTSHIISTIKAHCHIPVLLFPGHSIYLDLSADGILFLSLISGRNPELLIGQHILAAPIIKRSQLEVLPTGYMLIGNNNESTVSYLSNTIPIPSSKVSVAASTAMAGEMLGLKLIYLEAGSGAKIPVPEKLIKVVKKSVSVPVIVGGGLNSPEKAIKALHAGADLIILGNGVEENPELVIEVSDRIMNYNKTLDVHE